MLKIKCLCAVAAIAAAPLTVADELSETGEFLDGVAAIVNEGVVLKSQLRDETSLIIKRAQDQGFQLPPANVLQEQVLERLILTEIQLQRADQIGLPNVLADIQAFHKQHGERWAPAPLLEKLVAEGKSFADLQK